MKKEGLLTLREAAEVLGVQPVTLRKWDNEGKLKAIRIGSRGDRRYRREDVTSMEKIPMKLNWQEYIRGGLTYRPIDQVLRSLFSGLETYFGRGINHLMGYFEGDTMFWYYEANDLYKLGQHIIERFSDQKFLEKFFMDTYSKASEAIELTKIEVHKLNDNELKELFFKNVNLTHENYVLFWSIDGLDEALMIDTTKIIKDIMKKKLGDKFTESEFTMAYSTMMSPSKLSYLNEERIMALEIARDVKKGLLEENSKEYQARVLTIIDKFWWTNLGWAKGSPKSIGYVTRDINEILGSDLIPEKELSIAKNYAKNTAKNKDLAEKKYEFSKNSDLTRLLSLFDRFVEYHDFRKEVQMKTNFWEHKLIDEIAKRYKVPSYLLAWASVDEISMLLEKGKINDEELNQRRYNFFYTYSNGKTETFSGKAASRRHNEIFNLEVGESRDIQGVSASAGTAIGEAYVAITVANALEIPKGKILVTGMTTPDFVPAMRKAAAIVTDEGGITCHAAIISRELGIPCIVGTKYATRMIRSGDKIEVRANHGVIRILE